MTKLKIASFNTWNNLKKDGSLRAKKFSEIIKKEELDIIGLQEVTSSYKDSLMANVDEFSIFGEYRFSKILKYMPFNESNSIVTNKEVIFTKTYRMPYFPNNFRDLNESTNMKHWSLFPRIATVALVKVVNNVLCVINTHLDYKFNNVKKRQFNYLERIIKEYISYPIVLMGDFNTEENDKIFINFIKHLEDIDISKIKLNKDTFCVGKRKKTIDHIFVSNNIKVLKCKVIDTDISDHNMIVLNVEIK